MADPTLKATLEAFNRDVISQRFDAHEVFVDRKRGYSTDNPPRIPRPTQVPLHRHTVALNSRVLSE